MKALLSFCVFYFLFLVSYSQSVGIGTPSPNASAMLDISSTTKGILIPRMSSTQMNAIASPAAGLMVFNTTDSLFYVRKNSGWTKLVQPAAASLWSVNGNDIYNSNTGNVGIGTNSPSHSRFEVNSSIGAAVAMFAPEKFGVTLQADNPEVGFNYYYNNGWKAMKAGYASVIGMIPATGEFYIGNFTGNQSSTNYGNITGYRQNITLFQNGEFRIAGSSNFTHFYYGANEDTYIRGGKDGSNVIINDITGGKVGIGMNNPTRAVLEQYGSIGTTAAIFGGDGAGISLQKNWPVIGFNHYYDGVNHKSIGQGYNGLLGVNQSTGNMYIASFKDYAAIPNSNLTGYTERLFFSRFGRMGIGTDDPQADLTILTPAFYVGQDYSPLGLRFNNTGTSNYWNIWGDGGVNFSKNSTILSYINEFDGTYTVVSDLKRKKNILPVQSQTVQQILLLRPVKYLMKEEPESAKQHIGFISQEIEKIFPELVNDNKGTKFLNYTGLIPILTKGIQEQQQQIEELKNEIAELKKSVLAKK